MSAHCHDCGADLVFGTGEDWQLMTCPVCTRDKEIGRLRDALEWIARQQPSMVETLRSHGIVFGGPLGADPKNWQHVAFSIYTTLCEVDCTARQALGIEVGESLPREQGERLPQERP